MRFICGYLLIDVPCFACHQPRDQQQQRYRQQQHYHCWGRCKPGLVGNRAGHCSSSGAGSSSIAGVDASHAWKEAELATAAPPPRPAAAAALPLPGSMQAPPGRNRAGHIRTATTTSCSDSSSSSIAGRGT
ncbi:hypothetical protein PF004_g10348 [Phytophthora fragariae]|uniref:Uncharacterized protein n=1 Tax=Phytophthora fragariae TaxID=53985 RepID=A0A6G0P1J2_9STRA|nr:hypothetical protein PF004_g10348 [Phytophthora fragariae]